MSSSTGSPPKASKGYLSNKPLPLPTNAYGDETYEHEFSRNDIRELIHSITQELKDKGSKTPLILLPFRPKIVESKLTEFLSQVIPSGTKPIATEQIDIIVRNTDQYTLITALKYFWARLPMNCIIGWDAYDSFKNLEAKSTYPKKAFLEIMPQCLSSPSHASIVYDFLDLLVSFAANAKENQQSGRKISKMAGIWAFAGPSNSTKSTKSRLDPATNSFRDGVKDWLPAADAMFHLLLSFLRSMLPENESTRLQLPRTLQALLASNSYPPPDMVYSSSTLVEVPLVTIRSNALSNSPMELLNKLPKVLKFDDQNLFEAKEDYALLKSLCRNDANIINKLSSESRRILGVLCQNSDESLKPGWIEINQSNSKKQFETEVTVSRVSLDDYFIWTWMSSMSFEETKTKKSLFGRSLISEFVFDGFKKWIVVEERNFESKIRNQNPPLPNKGGERSVSQPHYKSLLDDTPMDATKDKPSRPKKQKQKTAVKKTAVVENNKSSVRKLSNPLSPNLNFLKSFRKKHHETPNDDSLKYAKQELPTPKQSYSSRRVSDWETPEAVGSLPEIETNQFRLSIPLDSFGFDDDDNYEANQPVNSLYTRSRGNEETIHNAISYQPTYGHDPRPPVSNLTPEERREFIERLPEPPSDNDDSYQGESMDGLGYMVDKLSLQVNQVESKLGRQLDREPEYSDQPVPNGANFQEERPPPPISKGKSAEQAHFKTESNFSESSTTSKLRKKPPPMTDYEQSVFSGGNNLAPINGSNHQTNQANRAVNSQGELSVRERSPMRPISREASPQNGSKMRDPGSAGQEQSVRNENRTQNKSRSPNRGANYRTYNRDQYPVRNPPNGYPPNGYPPNGYPANGYQANGYPANGYPANGYPANSYPANSYPANSYPANSYPANGYPANGYPSNGHPSSGYPPNGYPENGIPQREVPPKSYPREDTARQSFYSAASYPMKEDEDALYETNATSIENSKPEDQEDLEDSAPNSNSPQSLKKYPESIIESYAAPSIYTVRTEVDHYPDNNLPPLPNKSEISNLEGSETLSEFDANYIPDSTVPTAISIPPLSKSTHSSPRAQKESLISSERQNAEGISPIPALTPNEISGQSSSESLQPYDRQQNYRRKSPVNNSNGPSEYEYDYKGNGPNGSFSKTVATPQREPMSNDGSHTIPREDSTPNKGSALNQFPATESGSSRRRLPAGNGYDTPPQQPQFVQSPSSRQLHTGPNSSDLSYQRSPQPRHNPQAPTSRPNGYQNYPPQGGQRGYEPQQQQQQQSQGHPPQGYPPQGYPPQGYPPQGYPPQGYPPQGYPPQGYPPQGHPPQGYPPQGYTHQSYPPPARYAARNGRAPRQSGPSSQWGPPTQGYGAPSPGRHQAPPQNTYSDYAMGFMPPSEHIGKLHHNKGADKKNLRAALTQGEFGI